MTAKCIRCGAAEPQSPCPYSDVPCDGRMVDQEPDPHHLVYNLHAPLPADEVAAQALWRHLRELSLLCTSVGWSVAVTLHITKIEPQDKTDD